MAKKPPLDANLFSKTAAPTDKPGRGEDIIKARGVGLKLSEWAEVDEIAARLGVTPHALAAYGLREFMKLYKAGKIKIEVQTKKTL